MATKTFTKAVTYRQPPWSMDALLTDGIYVDDFFFKNNIPIVGANLTVRAKPTMHARSRELHISTNIYQGNQVRPIEVFSKHWYPWTDSELQDYIDLSNWFYGIGLNLLYVSMLIDLPTDAQVLYTVNYELEVTY